MLLLVGCVISFYIIRIQNTSDNFTDVGALPNRCNAITFKRKMHGNLLTICAESATLEEGGVVSLKDVRVSLKKKDGEVVICCQLCRFSPREKKAYLNKKVEIKSTGISCSTESVIVDLANNLITGNSEVRGVKSGMRFVSQGFRIRSDGNITLKRVKIIKGRK